MRNTRSSKANKKTPSKGAPKSQNKSSVKKGDRFIYPTQASHEKQRFCRRSRGTCRYIPGKPSSRNHCKDKWQVLNCAVSNALNQISKLKPAHTDREADHIIEKSKALFDQIANVTKVASSPKSKKPKTKKASTKGKKGKKSKSKKPRKGVKVENKSESENSEGDTLISDAETSDGES